MHWYLPLYVAAGRYGDRFALDVAHLGKLDDVFPEGWMISILSPTWNLFLNVDQGQAVRATDDVADILLAGTLRMAAHVVLLLMGVVAFVETVGITSISQRIQRTKQSKVERASCHGIVNRLTIYLCSSRDVVDDLVRPSTFSESMPIFTSFSTCSTRAGLWNS